MDDGEPRRLDQFSAFVETRTAERDVVRLPFARWSRGVEERRILAVDRRGLPVGIRVGLDESRICSS